MNNENFNEKKCAIENLQAYISSHDYSDGHYRIVFNSYHKLLNNLFE